MSTIEPDLNIPGYRIIRELGRGGMAKVYLAEQESMEREVAIKVMLPGLNTADPSFSERFLREARIVAKLSHPNIIAVIDVGVAGPYHYYSMEYHTGGDLKARIHDGMMPKIALSILRQVASALAFAHSKGYVHRDVKPENVMFRQDGTALLTDFGIAKSGGNVTRMTATGAIIGTPHYMSPEQAQGTELDHRSDLYSLGIMLYEMLTGTVPFTGSTALSIGIKHLKEPVPDLPPALRVYQPLLNKMLAKNPDDRYQNGEELVAAIDAMTSGAHPGMAPSSSHSPTVITGGTAASAATVITGAHQKTQITGAPTAAGIPAAEKSGGKRGIAIAAAVLVPLIAAGGYFMMKRSGPATPELPSSATTAMPSPAGGKTDNARVSQLLTEADVAALAGRYLEPADQSAVRKYKQVLEIDAGNNRATRGLQEIAKHYIAQTDQALEKKNYEDAEKALKSAEATDAANPLLASRQQALREARASSSKPAPARTATRTAPSPKPEPAPAPAKRQAPSKTVVASAPAQPSEAQQREQRITTLVGRIKELVAPGNLSATRTGLAADVFQEAARLAPGDPRVLNASNQIADAYLKLATAKVDDKEYKDAEALIRKGLELVPNHRLLASLQKDITDRQKPKRQTFGGF